MSISKFVLSIGAVVLVAIGALAEKLSAKRGQVTTIYYKTVGGVCIRIVATCSSSALLTTGGTGQQATLTTTTTGSLAVELFSTSNCTNGRAIHFHG